MAVLFYGANGLKDWIHFAHGNGFPALSYRQVLNGLSKSYRLAWIDRIGHDASYPVSDNWHYLVDEVIASIERQCDGPVIALGHSLGGVLSLVASMKSPQLFKAVILLDSPMIGRFKSNLIRMAKSLGVIDRITPAKKTKSRRQFWQHRAELEDYLSSRALFQTFSPECLNDYIEYGMQRTEEGYRLRFERDLEYQIYRTLPHILPRFHGQLTVPAAVIYGSESEVVKRSDLISMRKNYGMKLIMQKGTHMFPMESPQLTVEKIRMAIDELLQ